MSVQQVSLNKILHFSTSTQQYLNFSYCKSHPPNALNHFPRLSLVDGFVAHLVTYLFSPLTSSLLLPLMFTLSPPPMLDYSHSSPHPTKNSISFSPLMSTYHPNFLILKHILRENNPILLSDTSTKNLLDHPLLNYILSPSQPPSYILSNANFTYMVNLHINYSYRQFLLFHSNIIHILLLVTCFRQY